MKNSFYELPHHHDEDLPTRRLQPLARCFAISWEIGTNSELAACVRTTKGRSRDAETKPIIPFGEVIGNSIFKLK